MTKNELNEAIPPLYTQFIGEQLLAHIARARIHTAAMIHAEAGIGASLKA
jgi:hypothetical protein